MEGEEISGVLLDPDKNTTFFPVKSDYYWWCFTRKFEVLKRVRRVRKIKRVTATELPIGSIFDHFMVILRKTDVCQPAACVSLDNLGLTRKLGVIWHNVTSFFPNARKLSSHSSVWCGSEVPQLRSCQFPWACERKENYGVGQCSCRRSS